MKRPWYCVIFGIDSGLDGLMNILQSSPASMPFLIVAKTAKAWWHGERLLHEDLMCFASMNQVWTFLYRFFVKYFTRHKKRQYFMEDIVQANTVKCFCSVNKTYTEGIKFYSH